MYQNSKQISCFASLDTQVLSRVIGKQEWWILSTEHSQDTFSEQIVQNAEQIIQDAELFSVWKHRMQHSPCPHFTQLID